MPDRCSAPLFVSLCLALFITVSFPDRFWAIDNAGGGAGFLVPGAAFRGALANGKKTRALTVQWRASDTPLGGRTHKHWHSDTPTKMRVVGGDPSKLMYWRKVLLSEAAPCQWANRLAQE